MKFVNVLSLSFLSAIFFVGCQPKSSDESGNNGNNPTDTVITIDSAFVNNLFPPGKNILTGGDGAISIQADSTKSFFLWGDSFLGEVKDNRRSNKTPLIMGNVWVLLDGNKPSTIFRGTPDNPRSVLETDKVDGYPAILWPMHGFVKDNIVHVFMSVIVKTGEGTWDFYWHSSVYYRLNYPDLTVIDFQEFEPARKSDVHYGFGFYEYDGYYYMYGTKPIKEMTASLHTARARLIDNKLQQWEFFDGEKWGSDPIRSKELAGIDIPVSEQFSVFRHNDQFVLLTQDRFKPEIYSFVSDKPEGVWTNKKKLYTEPEGSNPDVFTYNAMAHPQYTVDNKLLVSYCVNAKNVPDLFTDASIYKPRFIRVPFDVILK
jgi:hypothetical protein